MQTLRGAVEALARDEGAGAPPARQIGPIGGELWLAIIRLSRVLRDRVGELITGMRLEGQTALTLSPAEVEERRQQVDASWSPEEGDAPS